MNLRAWGLAAVLFSGAAQAQEIGAANESEDDDDDGVEESITGKTTPPLPSEPQSVHVSAKRLEEIKREKADADSPYPATTFLGAETLKLDPQYVFEVQRGIELVFLRDYNGARDHFEKLDAAYPGTGVAEVIDVLVWQALMLENFDFKYSQQYWVSSKAAREALDVALKAEGGEGWEHLLYCGVSGIEAIHTMRQSQYTKALSLAFEAMGHLKESKEAAPDFPDLLLADGMYNYWRSVVTMTSKVLPDFGDRRVEGIEQIQAVEQAGVFLAPAATLSMAFTWLEEGAMKKALASCQTNRRAYPQNVVNNLVTGSTYVYMKKYDEALQVFDEVQAVDPKNKRVLYWKGVAKLRKGDAKGAEKELRAYLASDYLETYQRAAAHWRLGTALQKQKDWGGAAGAYEEAVKLDKHKGAKHALAKLKERRKEGKISW